MTGFLDFFSVGTEVAGEMLSAESQAIQLEAQAAASKFNAESLIMNAAIQRTKTKADVERQKRETYIRQGKAIAAAGASGGLTGSALDVIASNAAQEELDLLNIKQQAALTETGLLRAAQLEILQATSSKQGAELARRGGKIAATGTAVKAVSSGASSLISLLGGA